MKQFSTKRHQPKCVKRIFQVKVGDRYVNILATSLRLARKAAAVAYGKPDKGGKVKTK